MNNDNPPVFGRIRLTDVMAEWSDDQPINPRLLASEVAGVLRSLGDEGRALERHHASITMFDPASGPGAITYGALADYFDSLSLGITPETLPARVGDIRCAAVALQRRWIDRIADEATQRAAIATGLLCIDVQAPVDLGAGCAVAIPAPPAPPSGSSSEALEQRIADHHLSGEQSAAAHLDAEREARLRAEAAAHKERIRADAMEAKYAALMDEADKLKQERNEAVRAATIAEHEAEQQAEALRELQPFMDAIDPNNPLSPREFRRAFQCWSDLTKGGTHNPRGPGGRGVHSLVDAWIEDQGAQLGKEELARLRAVVNWHKKPGAVRTS